MPPDIEEAWTPQAVVNRRHCAVRGAMPLFGEREVLQRTGLEASDAETA